MKRINLFILPMLLVLILYLVCSCGNVAVPLGVHIYVYKDATSSFTADELKRLRITSNGATPPHEIAADGTALNYVEKDKNGDYYRILSYHLGIGHSEWQAKNVSASYKSKMQTFYFTIEDTSGVYETFTMNPLDNTYTIVDESIPLIKYTVTLKKK